MDIKAVFALIGLVIFVLGLMHNGVLRSKFNMNSFMEVKQKHFN